MFVRKKKNKSGSISVHIVEKSDGNYRIIHSVGSPKDNDEINHLVNEAVNLMPKFSHQATLNFGYSQKNKTILDFIAHNKTIRIYTLTKKHINNRGYNKFLTLTGDVAVVIDEEKVETDKQWDGLKRYITNTKLKYEYDLFFTTVDAILKPIFVSALWPTLFGKNWKDY